MTDVLDTRPFRRRVAELMARPARTCSPSVPAAEAARHMAALGISALVVVQGDRPVGIVTERDLVAKVLAVGRPPGTAVGDIMSAPVQTIRPTDFFTTALLTMVRHRCKHLPVVDAGGTLVGMVTMSDLTRRRDLGALAIADGIEWAPDVQALNRAREQADAVLLALLDERTPPAELLAVATGFNDRLVRRCLSLAESLQGPPPVPYGFIIMGSLGRGEQYARTDQDNGLVWANPPPGKEDAAATYFEHLGARAVALLEKCGFALCPGNVMASNPVWRRSLREWRSELLRWGVEPTPERIRHATIFYDFRVVAGDPALGDALRAAALEAANETPRFLHHLANDDLEHRVPLGPFGLLLVPRWGPRRGLLDLKTDACVHLVDGLRCLALKHRIAATNSLERARELASRKELDSSFAEWIESAFDTLMGFRIARGLRGVPQANAIQADELSEKERARLKEALVAVAQLQEHLGLAFRAGDYK